MVFGAEMRRRWRSWLILVVLIAVVGGLVLAAAAAGRRTATAFPRFVTAHGYDFLIFNIQQPLPGLDRLPEVASVTTAVEPIYGNLSCTCGSQLNNVSNFAFVGLPPRALDRVTKLLDGRMPTQSAPDEVLASVNLEQQFGVHVGTVIRTTLYASSQLQTVLNAPSNVNIVARGPAVTLHVVGIEEAESEFPAGAGQTYDIYTTQAFNRRAGPAEVGLQYYVRLRHGAADLPRFQAAVNGMRVFFSQNQDNIATAVAASIQPQAVGWWVLAVLAALAGLAVIGQALGRQSVVESEEYPTLAALGLPRNQLVALGTTRNLVVALAGAVGAVIIAFALSPLTPVGEARLAEPSTGLAFDPLILLPGALTIVMAVLVLGIWPAIRASRARINDERAMDAYRSPIVGRLAATGAPPSILIGVRHALERGRGAATIPVGTALFGMMLAVLGLCATAVFGASLSHLTATPALYGDDYQVVFANHAAYGGNPTTEVAALKGDPAITGIMIGTRNEVSINGVSVFSIAGKAVRGPLLLSSVSGQLPRRTGEIVLGTTTMHQVGAHVGSLVHVTVQVPTGGTHTAPFRVVGTVSFPGQFGLGGLGTGAAFTFAGYQDAACPPGPAQGTCQSASHALQQGAVLASSIPGPRGAADITHYINTSQGNGERPTTPDSLVNFGEAVNFPLIFGAMLALFGVATLMHLLVVSVGRRRREIGLLKALGFVNFQVGAAVCWQAITVALVGIAVGVPLGIGVGEAVWRAFATNLGAVPVSVVPTWLIVVLALGVLVISNLLALAPALVAVRSKTVGQLMHTQ
jgi:ABC-type lipoprotein release transport system permease subunit